MMCASGVTRLQLSTAIADVRDVGCSGRPARSGSDGGFPAITVRVCRWLWWIRYVACRTARVVCLMLLRAFQLAAAARAPLPPRRHSRTANGGRPLLHPMAPALPPRAPRLALPRPLLCFLPPSPVRLMRMCRWKPTVLARPPLE
jgi:hypothetical protein